MKKTTFSQFRNNAKKYLDTVEQGETVEIYRHGKPVAFVSPVTEEPQAEWNAGGPVPVSNVSAMQRDAHSGTKKLVYREATKKPSQIKLPPPLKKPVDSLAFLLKERGREQ